VFSGATPIIANPTRVLYAGSRMYTPMLDRLAPARAAGFTALSVWPSDVQGMDLGATRQCIEAAGLAVSDIELIGNWLPAQQDIATSAWPALKWQTPAHVFPIASALGAQTVSAAELFGLPFDGIAMARSFRDLCFQAADIGLRIALESVPGGGIATLAQAWDVVERADCNNGGLMVDSWHFHRSKSSLSLLASIPGDRIFSIQLSDAALEVEADLSIGMVNRLMPGDGAVDFAGFMQALKATGTKAPIGIEAFCPALDALPIETAMQACAKALDACLALAC
jgi:sugar phosphate isomerase/epimerase